jgi:hypothetical protein
MACSNTPETAVDDSDDGCKSDKFREDTPFIWCVAPIDCGMTKAPSSVKNVSDDAAGRKLECVGRDAKTLFAGGVGDRLSGKADCKAIGERLATLVSREASLERVESYGLVFLCLLVQIFCMRLRARQ